MQSVLISATTERRWYRLVGQRADVRVWSARPADELGAASGRRCRAYPSGLNPRENWVREVIEKAGRGIVDGLALGVIGDNLADAPCALLEGRPTGSSANSSANSAGRPEPARLREVRRADARPCSTARAARPHPIHAHHARCSSYASHRSSTCTTSSSAAGASSAPSPNRPTRRTVSPLSLPPARALTPRRTGASGPSRWWCRGRSRRRSARRRSSRADY